MNGPNSSIKRTPPSYDDGLWELIDSWFNHNPQPCLELPVQDDQHHHHDQSNITVAFNGGDDGMKSEHGLQRGVAIEDNRIEDNEDNHPVLSQIVWPSYTLDPDSCSSCQVLRDIVHKNGTHTTKFELHGNVGRVSHAIYSSNDGLASSDLQTRRMIDLCGQNIEFIKELLKDYIEEHGQNGSTLLQDSHSIFYEGLCTGFYWRKCENNPARPRPLTGALEQREIIRLNFEEGESSRQVIRKPQQLENPLLPNHDDEAPTITTSAFSIQRKRVKNLTHEDLAKYFHKPLETASEELGLSATAIKNKLRSFNIARWPYRKVNSMIKKLASLQEEMGTTGHSGVENEIQNLQQKITDILNGRSLPA